MSCRLYEVNTRKLSHTEKCLHDLTIQSAYPPTFGDYPA